jgi:hypothetical protein
MSRLILIATIAAAAAGCYDASEPCNRGLEHGASYRITLGDPIRGVPLQSDPTFCSDVQAFDTLKTGSTLDVSLPMGVWGGNTYCEVPLADLLTDLGLMLTPIGDYGGSARGGEPLEDMFVVNEMGSSAGCAIQWSLDATSTNAVAALPAGITGQDLRLVREITWADQPTCPKLRPTGLSTCFDAWHISLAKLP